jgi:hypothetical protein
MHQKVSLFVRLSDWHGGGRGNSPPDATDATLLPPEIPVLTPVPGSCQWLLFW